MRLFVATEIPAAVRRSLTEVAAGLRRFYPGARWTRLDDAHITLKFIGEISATQAHGIQQALRRIHTAVAVHSIPIQFKDLGFFPDERHPRVFWAGIAGGASLAQLHSSIEDALALMDIPRETRDFHPHITLARFPDRPGGDLSPLCAAIAALATTDFGSASVTHFSLYQSILKSSGAEYTQLETYPLCGEQAP